MTQMNLSTEKKIMGLEKRFVVQGKGGESGMELEALILSKVPQKEKHQPHMMSLISGL